MKKIIILLLLVLLVTGCTNIGNSSYDELIREAINSDVNIYNTYRKGYKFYLPKGLYVEESDDYNEVIKSNNVTFYLYIDVIGYLSGEKSEYTTVDNVYYSKEIINGDESGYVEIKVTENNKYLVEIMYNYAKIEVIVEKSDINKALTDAIIILSSIDYNDTFLTGLDKDSLLNYKEETVDIFDKSSSQDSNWLEYADVYDSDDDDGTTPDYDLIK
jgi:hypothetical protein